MVKGQIQRGGENISVPFNSIRGNGLANSNSKDAARMLQGCSKDASRMLQGCSMPAVKNFIDQCRKKGAGDGRDQS